MTILAGLLPKLAVFVVAAMLGGSVTYIGASALSAPGITSSAVDAPDFVLDTPPDSADAGAVLGDVAAFDLIEAGNPSNVDGLPPADLAFAAAALLDDDPVTDVNPLGYPRIPPVSQFDGGPFANANCTLAAGAMLARLGWGIVTTGSILRTLQSDQVGGTGLDDLTEALVTGYGVAPDRGLLTPTQLRTLLSAGFGVVIQGLYGKIPPALRLQASFAGPHAIYIDGYYPGHGGTPAAYYVIDPLGRPSAGYKGDWWPASIIDQFGTGLGHGGRIASAWAYPPGGPVPDVGLINVPPIPASGGEEPGPTPTPGPSLGPGETPGVDIVPLEPGDVSVAIPTPVDPIDGTVTIGGLELVPWLVICIINPTHSGCPGGIEGVYEAPLVPIPQIQLGPTVTVVFVDSDRPNIALVGFRVSPSAPADVRYWEADGSPATVRTASSMSVLDLLGQPTIVARLDVLATTTYHFQVVAGDGFFTGSSPIGTFTTGNGVVAFDVAVSASSPAQFGPLLDFGVLGGISPYAHVPLNLLLPPLEPCLAVDGGLCQIRAGALGPSTSVACTDVARLGGTDFCLRRVAADAGPALEVCQRANVSYELSGVEGTGVLVRAFPGETAVLPDGGITLEGILEATGPASAGEVSIGCLGPGLTYTIVLDAVGDDRGILAARVIAVP